MFGRGVLDPFGMLQHIGFGHSLLGSMFSAGAMPDPFAHMDRMLRGPFDHAPRHHRRSRNSQQTQGSGGPIVQEPDADPEGGSVEIQDGDEERDEDGGPLGSLMRLGTGGGASSYSYSSVTVWHGGGPSGGYTYSKTESSTRRPDGLLERQVSEHDTRTGVERIGVQRQIGSRGRTVIRERDATGQERKHERLHGIAESEKHAFDEEWAARTGDTAVPRRGIAYEDPAAPHAARRPVVIEEADDDAGAGAARPAAGSVGRLAHHPSTHDAVDVEIVPAHRHAQPQTAPLGAQTTHASTPRAAAAAPPSSSVAATAAAHTVRPSVTSPYSRPAAAGAPATVPPPARAAPPPPPPHAVSAADSTRPHASLYSQSPRQPQPQPQPQPAPYARSSVSSIPTRPTAAASAVPPSAPLPSYRPPSGGGASTLSHHRPAAPSSVGRYGSGVTAASTAGQQKR